MKNIHWSFLLSAFTIILAFAFGIILSPRLPGNLASHWNIKGEVDGYTPQNIGLYLLPLIAIILLFLLTLLPKLDPYRKNFFQFEKYYHIFICVITGFLVYIYILTLFWNLGLKFSFLAALSPAFSILFFYMGVLLDKTRPNWFVGIRTPWTLSDPVSWQKTHTLGSKLFKLSALVGLVGLIVPSSFYLMFFPLIGVSLVLTVYSYLIYRQNRV